MLVAASTHPGEEEAVIAAHAELKQQGRAAPHHPRAAPSGARRRRSRQQVERRRPLARRRSRGEAIDAATDIYLADTIGEMGLWYRLADIAFLGGSMVPRGGQNPIEPAKLSVPILHGPHVGNFRDVYDALASRERGRRVGDATALRLPPL